MKKLIFAAIGLVGIGAAYLYSTPYLALEEIKSSIAKGDLEEFSTRADVTTIRSEFNEHGVSLLRPMLEKTAHEDFRVAHGLERIDMLAEQVTDSLLTPVGLANLLAGDWGHAGSLELHDLPKIKARQVNPKFLNSSSRYLSFDQFRVTVPNHQGGEIQFILERTSITQPWILSHIELPDPDLIRENT